MSLNAAVKTIKKPFQEANKTQLPSDLKI